MIIFPVTEVSVKFVVLDRAVGVEDEAVDRAVGYPWTHHPHLHHHHHLLHLLK